MTQRWMRFLVAFLALLAALYAQYMTAVDPFAIPGWVVYGVAALAFALATMGRDAASAESPIAEDEPVDSPMLRAAAAVVAVVALLAAIWLSESALYPWTSFALWCVALLAASFAVRAMRIAPPLRSSPAWTRNEVITIVILALAALVARLVWLNSIPYHVMGDEPRVAAQVYRYGRGELRSFFHMGWNTWPTLGMMLQGILTPFFGVHTTTLRMSSALAGSLAVVSTYVLARELISRRVAVLTAVLFVICRTGIDFSRLGICHAQVMLFGSLAFALWFRALNTGKALTFLWSGIAVGLCLYTYNAGQSFPPLLFSWIAISAVFYPRAFRTHPKAVALVVVGFVFCVSPLVIHITDHFGFTNNWVQWTHMARNRQVVNLISEVWQNQGWAAAQPMVYRQVFGTLLGFTAIPAGAYGIGYRGGGLLDHISSALFILGIGVLLMRVLRREAILLYWLGVTLFIGSVLTDDPPATVRMVGLVPTLPLIAAIGLSAFLDLTDKVKLTRSVGVGVATLLLALAAYDTWRTYFVIYAATEPDGPTDLARRFDAMPKETVGRLLGSQDFLRFGDELFEINFFGRDLLNVDEPAHLLPIHTPMLHPLAVVLAPSQVDLAPYIKSLYPQAETYEFYAKNDQRLLYRMVTLSREQMAERAGLTMTAGDGVARVGDPFDAKVTAAGQLEWSGRIYWPTDHAAILRIRDTRSGELKIAGQAARPFVAGQETQTAIQLPVGWNEISIRESAGGERGLSLSLEYDGKTQQLDRWSLRPDAGPEGLTGVYKRGSEVLLRRTDPQLNMFAQENLWEPPRHDLVVRSPFSVDWSGSLRAPADGEYTLTVSASGPYRFDLDETRLCGKDDIVPEQAQQCTVTRHLTKGMHPIKVHWDSNGSPHSSRRMFQLFWTPPGGVRALVPPTGFVPSSE